MSPVPPVATLDDPLLRGIFGNRTFDRGRAYARQGRATVAMHTPGLLRGVVRGSATANYRTEVVWSSRPGGLTLLDSCSCPVGGRCKHGVALIVSARDQVATAASASTGPDWRTALDGVVVRGHDTATTVPLALELVAATVPGRYGAATTSTVTIRPLRLSKNGLLASSGASQYYPDPKPMPLGRFGPLVWYHLARSVDAGVRLLGKDGTTGAVELLDPAEASLELRTRDDGGVVVTCELRVDGTPLHLPASQTVLVGDPVHGAFVAEAERLRLVPFATPLARSLAALATGPGVVVPERDVDELLDLYQPELERIIPVGSSDGSVPLLRTTFEGLVLRIDRPAIDAASAVWAARYRRGERTRDHLLFAPDRSEPRAGRDLKAEAGAVAALDLPVHLLPALVDLAGRPAHLDVRGTDAVVLLSDVVPWLRDRGSMAVEVSDALPELRSAEDEPLISLSVTDAPDSEAAGNDWFDLAVEVSIDGETVDFATLFTALAVGDEVLVLPSGTWFRLDHPQFASLRTLIDEARGLADPAGAGVARISPFQTGWWEELARLGVVAQQSARWSSAIERMRELRAPARVPVPASLQASLRPYQRDGLDWLVFLHTNGLGGILADDMGLGKTVQTLALSLHVLAQDRSAKILVVAPTSVVENWRREAANFAPDLSVTTITETEKRRGTPLADEVAGAQVVVTSYALFRLEFEAYQVLPWEVLLLDEAQFVKNHQAKTYRCVRRLDVATKVAITGTPMENSLMDLWSLLSITAPGLYPDPKRFSEVYRVPIESGRHPERLATLRRRIAPLMRRRTKDEVLAELPPKIEQTVEVELSPRHARIYQTQLQRQRKKVLGLVGDVQRNRFEILKSLTMLRQLSLDPGLVDSKHGTVGSAKLDRLLTDLEQVVAEGHRALVFSQFTRYLARVRTRLDEAGIAYAYLDGRTRRRDEQIAAFKDGDAPVFVISLKAGGFGLNLTEADYCFVLDPWWNPAAETQAVDRAHRIGQPNQVMVYRYVSVGTIEEKVMALKERKAALFSDVMNDDAGALSGPLSATDIEGLLDLSG